MTNAPPASVDVFRFERRAAAISLTVGIALMAIKFIAYFLTRSSAIFSDALESIVNVLASGFALYSVILAHAPADKSHPYGHGKIEFLAAAFEGGMIVIAAIIIAAQAIIELYHGAGPQKVDWGLLLVAGAMIVNGAAGFYLIASGKRHGSFTLEADGKHLLSDAVTSAAVLVALGIVKVMKWPLADPIAALCIAGYITWMAVGLLRRSAAGLMDEQDLADNAMIEAILDSHLGPDGKSPRICSYHKLRHRHSGRFHWVDFHMMVPSEWDVKRGHEAASSIEYEIEQALGEGNATAHVEPCADASCGTCELSRAATARG
jgi:cation diffusion facilitator family transporter